MTTDRSPDFPEMLLKKFANSIADGWMSGFERIFFLAKRGRIGSAKAFNNAPKPMTTIDNPRRADAIRPYRLWAGASKTVLLLEIA
jgi:hypothetical protein